MYATPLSFTNNLPNKSFVSKNSTYVWLWSNYILSCFNIRASLSLPKIYLYYSSAHSNFWYSLIFVFDSCASSISLLLSMSNFSFAGVFSSILRTLMALATQFIKFCKLCVRLGDSSVNATINAFKDNST